MQPRPPPLFDTRQLLAAATDEVQELLEAAYSVAAGSDPKLWREHTDKALARHKRTPLDEVTGKVCRTLLDFVESVPNLGVQPEQLGAETVPFYLGLYQWGLAGYPHFSLMPDFFDAMLVTDFGDPTDEPVFMPFDAFTVSFPQNDYFQRASRAFVYRVPTVSIEGSKLHVTWHLYRATLMTDDPVFSQWGIGMSRKQLVDEAVRLDAVPPGARQLDPDEVALMPRLRALLLNLVSYLDAAGPLPTAMPVKGAAPAAVERAHKTRPMFDVGRPVRLDGRLRQAMRAGGGKGGWEVAQRFIVRGHWRNQPYGEGRALRRRRWIDPFWKGPENVIEALSRTYEVR